MIIRKNPISVITRNGIPDSNWADETDVFVVDDNSELGQKILNNQLYFDFVLDENGNLIDITPTERPPEPPKTPTAEERIAQLETENTLLKAQTKANTDVADFHEELIVELAMMVYP